MHSVVLSSLRFTLNGHGVFIKTACISTILSYLITPLFPIKERDVLSECVIFKVSLYNGVPLISLILPAQVR